MLHKTDWNSVKQIRTDNGNLTLYYVQDGIQYTVVLGDRNQIYWALLKEAADITDFETNFKAGATPVISLDDAISKIFLDQDTDEEIALALSLTVIEKTTSQDLSLAALDFTTDFATDIQITHVTFKFDSNHSGQGEISIDALAGVNFDTVIQKLVMNSNKGVFYQPEHDLFLKNGNEIRVQINQKTNGPTVFVVISGIKRGA